MRTDSRRDDLLGAISVIVLLIGSAIDNPYAMLGISIAILFLMVVLSRWQIRSGATMTTLATALTTAAVAIVMATQ